MAKIRGKSTPHGCLHVPVPCLPLDGGAPQEAAAAHVLLASADRALRREIVSMLSDGNHLVSACDHPRQALQLLDQSVDLVVADIVMPDLDGLELLRHVRDFNHALPVILIAAGLGEIDRVYRRYARLFGAAEIFGRPIQAGAFLQGVKNALNGAPVPSPPVASM